MRFWGKEIEFKDLGLLIVDEEQKFGVSAKEKLRKIKVNVDTLNIGTAMPIPRTFSVFIDGCARLIDHTHTATKQAAYPYRTKSLQ